MSRKTGCTASPLWRRLWSLTWPALQSEDAESVRRNKLGVRGLNGVLIGMVSLLLLVLAGELAAKGQWWQLTCVGLGALSYLLWALLGITPITELVLRPCDAAKWPARAWPGTPLFFTVELLIATWIIVAALPVNPVGVLRIVLLPILAHAVIFLNWRGIALTALLCANL